MTPLQVRVPLNAISLSLEEIGDISRDVRHLAATKGSVAHRIRTLARDVRLVAREARHSSGAMRQLLDDVLTAEKLSEVRCAR